MAVESSPTENSPLLQSSNGTLSGSHVESGIQDDAVNNRVQLANAQKKLKYIVPAVSLGVCFYPTDIHPRSTVTNRFLGLPVGC